MKRKQKRPVEPRFAYFAYGSNLSLKQMAQRCPNHETMGATELRDYELIFVGRSNTYGHTGVATILPSPGQVVPGALYLLTEDCWDELDRCEGVASGKYKGIVVELECGAVAFTYIADEHYLEMGETPPSRVYLNRIRDGYQEWGLDVTAIEELESAEDKIQRVFVYGTLKRDGHNHRLLDGAYTRCESGAKTRGQLYYSYGMREEGAGVPPAARSLYNSTFGIPVLVGGCSGYVEGELYTIDTDLWPSTLARLDRLEGLRPGTLAGSNYKRVLRLVTRRNGKRVWAWVYISVDPLVATGAYASMGGSLWGRR